MVTSESCKAWKTVLSDVQKGWGQSIDSLILSDSESSQMNFGSLFNSHVPSLQFKKAIFSESIAMSIKTNYLLIFYLLSHFISVDRLISLKG